MAGMGRPAIFRHKLAMNNVHGMMTIEGAKCFEAARKALALIVEWKPERVSDGDVIEFLARGERNTRQYLKNGKMT